MNNISLSLFWRNELNTLDIGGCFVDCSKLGMIAINIKLIDNDGNTVELCKNKPIFIYNDFSIWSCSFHIDAIIHSPFIAVVEVHSLGNLLYIKKYNLTNVKETVEVYYKNTEVCYRREDQDTISVFNTNGNLLFLRGVYFSLWILLDTPLSLAEIQQKLTKSGYSLEKIEQAISALVSRRLIIKKYQIEIDRI